jgi:adenylate cyclase
MKKHGALWAILAAVGLLCAAGARTGLFDPAELKTLDWRFKRFPGASRKDAGIVLLMLDQQSLDHFEADGIYWPWPRSVYGAVLDFCKAAGAKTVAFDVLFTSPSPYGVSEDKAFASSLKSFGPAVLAMETTRGGTKLPVPLLRSAVSFLGDTKAAPDADGVFRKVPVSSQTLAGAVLRAIGREDALAAAPVENGKLQVLFHGPRPYPTFPLGRVVQSWQAIQEKAEPSLGLDALKDKIVLVGYSAPGLMDLRPSPVSPVSPGTEIIAADVGIVLFAALGAGVIVTMARGFWGSFGGIALLSLILNSACNLAFVRGTWLAMAAPQLSLWLSFAAASAYGYATEGRKKREIQGAFARYLAPEVVAEIAENPEKLVLGGERRELTCYFSDIESFTTISEGLPPDRLTYLMNRYLSEMTDTVLESKGTLDKYIGDAIMAFWGAPVARPDHALAACKVALTNQKKLVALRQALIEEGFPPVRARIGLNSGFASVGNMGSSQRFSYTAMGDDINLASRLEGSNKTYGTFLMISHSTREQAGAAIEVRELDLLKVKGKNKAVRVYELLGLAGETDAAAIKNARRFEEGLALYRARDFAKAAGIFKELLPDAAAELYVERCAHFQAEPPPADWDGSYASKEK